MVLLVVFSCSSSLSNGLIATESRRASCTFIDSLVQRNMGPSKLGIWLKTNATTTEGQTFRRVTSVPIRTTRCFTFRGRRDWTPR